MVTVDTRHLEFFVAVAEELSFTRAATRVQAVQSTVSAGISSLEREVGAPLFVRSTRHVALSAAGRALLPQARAAVEAVTQMRHLGARAGGRVQGTIRIGMLTNLESLGLPEVLGDFHREHPAVDLSMRTSPRGSTGLVDDVRRSRVDVAFCGLALGDLVGVHAQLLRRQPFVAVLPPEHAHARGRVVLVEDLLDEDFIEMPVGFGTRKAVDDWLRESGLRRRVTIEVPDLSTVPAYVVAGLGVALVPEQTAFGATGVAVVPLARRPVWDLSVIARLGDRAPAVDALLAHLAARLAEQPR
ncbi:DNA-binding transcriptional LysR family regulator [Humibacillus xanthopallidus]|uniref:DNA-binding transcriptional LysR family regulator n=1 Tax=Humibacillus xanthopallidus TaxID=412689 RepID=A0A543I1C8_9MICO|nr:DNA-binding transcriptional LysR family regulator [Humibacillus xanthopallidus]